MTRPRLVFPVILLLAGCGSSPETHYYKLSVVGAEATHAAPTAAPVQVTAVHLPPSLDRLERVVQSGPNRVQLSDQERWSAPLDEMARDVLSQDLRARLPPGAVVMPDAPAPKNTRQIVVSVAQFGPNADGEVELTGDWSLLKPGTDDVIGRQPVSLRTPAGRDADSQVGAMSRLLGQLAAQIASATGTDVKNRKPPA